MKKLIVPLVILFALCAVAQAQNAHFIRGPVGSFDTSTGEFCISFTEAGLGNTPITYTLSVDSELFTFQCFTRSGNQPQGDPNGQSFSNQSVSTTITPHNSVHLRVVRFCSDRAIHPAIQPTRQWILAG
jgi:hypothetical protein